MQYRILVLGASGFIGQRLLGALADSGWAQPVALSRRASAIKAWPGVEKIDGDSSNALVLSGAMKGVVGVVNCVAGTPQDMVATADAILAAAKVVGHSPRVLNLSSLAVYGDAIGKVEESAGIVGGSDTYSQAKVEIEKRLLEYPSVVTLRPGIVYGPGSPLWSEYIAQLLMAGCLGNLGARGEGVCNLVHVDDVVAVVLEGLRRPGIDGLVFNLASPAPPTWNQYFSMYGAALGMRTIPTISSFRIALELYALAGPRKFGQLLSQRAVGLGWHATPPLRPWLLKECQKKVIQSVHRVEAVLGTKWIPLDKGLAQTANWFLTAT